MPALLLYFGCCSLWRVVTSFTDSSEVNKTRVHHFLFPLRISNYPEFAFKSVSFGYCNQLLVSHVFVTINYLKLGNFIPVYCKYNGRSVARYNLDMPGCWMELRHEQWLSIFHHFQCWRTSFCCFPTGLCYFLAASIGHLSHILYVITNRSLQKKKKKAKP